MIQKAERFILFCVKYFAFIGVGLAIAFSLEYGLSWFWAVSLILCIVIWILSLQLIHVIDKEVREVKKLREELNLDTVKCEGIFRKAPRENHNTTKESIKKCL